jgi:hypothetical protein
MDSQLMVFMVQETMVLQLLVVFNILVLQSQVDKLLGLLANCLLQHLLTRLTHLQSNILIAL